MHKCIVTILVVIVFTIPLLTVHVLFKCNSEITWLEAEWSAGDVLGYVAGFEAFMGATVLGLVSVYQNKKANETNERLLEMQKEQQRIQVKEKAAPVDVTPIILEDNKEDKMRYVVCDEKYADEFSFLNTKYSFFRFLEAPGVEKGCAKLFNMVIELENISDIVLTEIKIENLKVYDFLTNVSGVSVERENAPEYKYDNDPYQIARCFIKPHEKTKLCIQMYMDEIRLDEETFFVNFDLATTSIYNVGFSANVTLYRNNIIDENDRVFVTMEHRRFFNLSEIDEKRIKKLYST